MKNLQSENKKSSYIDNDNFYVVPEVGIHIIEWSNGLKYGFFKRIRQKIKFRLWKIEFYVKNLFLK